MKKNIIVKTAAALVLATVMFTAPVSVVAGESVNIERTKAWDGIEYSLGGLPESVVKIEYAGSVFYLGTGVTEAEFLAVLAVGPEAVGLKPPQENGKLYSYPVYILWNSDKSVLLVHPIIFDNDDILEPVAVPADPPASLMEEKPVSTTQSTPLTDEQEYMLSPEYADAVRADFYRLINEYRAANGLRELDVDVALQGYADIRADELRTLYSHTRPDNTPAGSGWHGSWNVINSRYAENAAAVGAIGSNPASAALGIFNIWKESAGHNRHMLYDFEPEIKMGFGIAPVLDDDGFVVSGAIFASGY
jgi:uncharacterized protein YkwD